jgi:hypothetical protein
MEIENYPSLLEKQDEILQVLENETAQVRKTILAVLVSLFGTEKTEKIRKQMLLDASNYNETLKGQKRTEKQEKNWISWTDVEKRWTDLNKELSPLLKKNPPTPKDVLKLVDLILLSVFVLIPPRRSMDFTEMKIKNYNVNEDNYYDNKAKQFVFNRYKTDKTYGKQVINVPPTLHKILSRWVKINPNEHLIFDSKGAKMSPSRLTIKLNNIFGKNVSSTLLRHIYITEKVLHDAPRIKERESVAEAMGHSKDQQDLYRVE